MAADGILYAVDPYPVGRLGVSLHRYIAHSEVRRVRNGKVRWVRTTGADAARSLGPELAGSVDFVFINGDHSYDGLRADWEGWSGLIAPGGSIALHDSRSSPARSIDDTGSVRFTSEVILADPRYEVADTIDSLTVLGDVPHDTRARNQCHSRRSSLARPARCRCRGRFTLASNDQGTARPRTRHNRPPDPGDWVRG